MNARHCLARLSGYAPLVILLQGCAATSGSRGDDATPPPAVAQEPQPAPPPAPQQPAAQPFEPSAPGEIVSEAVKSERRFIVGDLLRANIATVVEQGPPGILRVGIGRGFHSQGSREFYFRRLASAYHTWVQEGQPLAIEIWESGRKIGEYLNGLFAIGSDHTTPRECPDTATTGLCSGKEPAAPPREVALPGAADTLGGRPESAPPPRERSGFHVGLGLGAGLADRACTGCDFASKTGVSGFVSLGGAIDQKTVVGVESTGWTKSEVATTRQMYSVMGQVTRYLSRNSGLFLRGGLGLVGYRENRDAGDLTANAPGFSGRLGYEIGRGKYVLVPYVGLVRTFAGADFKREGEDIGFNAALSNLHFGLSVGTH
jgi:hypothetical protein